MPRPPTKRTSKKKITIDDLAALVVDGFSEMQEGMDPGFLAVRSEFRVELKSEIESLRNTVNNYLELSEERYLELKQRLA